MERYEYSKEKREVLESSLVPFAIYQFINKRVVTLILSDGFCKLFDYEDKDKAYYDMDHNMYWGTHPDDVARAADAAFKFATEGGEYDIIYRSKDRFSDGYRIIHSVGEHFTTETGVQLAQVWYMDEGFYNPDSSPSGSEFSASLNEALHRESIISASYYDYLTGLPSMTYFFELAEAGCKELAEEGKVPTFLFLDLSGMKHYNHKHGFANGDKLIRAFAELIIKYFSNENCSRFGQDHFAVFTESNGIDDRLHMIFNDWQRMNVNSLPIRAGVYFDAEEKTDISTACDRAKLACDTLRNRYVSGIHYFNKAMQDGVEKQQYIISNLDRAIKEKWITVYYQPIIRAINGCVCDEEALARWIDPVMGFLSPADFIPILEDSGLIYKLDICVLEQVIEKLKLFEKEGLHLVPQSINLSRNDFEACDIVGEVLKRVDEAGISHDLITIEITESIIGSNFEFMKQQLGRFRKLGFAVWMDDFGSGYSSLDVLQDLELDLIKFDMRFLKNLDQGENGKIILTELMRMATALGMDTVCEGVETAEHAVFLREIGCSKLQGYYYEKPIPVDKILEKYRKGTQIGFENPEELSYYEAVGRLNLYDIAGAADESDSTIHRYFNTLPVAVMEIKDDRFLITRYNRSYKEYVRKSYGIELKERYTEYSPFNVIEGNSFNSVLSRLDEINDRTLLSERMSNNMTLHAFVRRIAENPVKGTMAIAVAVLAITDDRAGVSYERIARALAKDYFHLFYINLNSEKYIEYTSDTGEEDITVEARGEDFFNQSRKNAPKILHKDDVDGFLAAFNRENILNMLDEQGTFTLIYRMLRKDEYVYVNMKAMRIDDDHLIIGVSSIDSQMKK